MGDASLVLQHRARGVGTTDRARGGAEGLPVQTCTVGVEDGGKYFFILSEIWHINMYVTILFVMQIIK